MSERITCWYCNISGPNILDESGCCKRCGTNLKKWPKRNKLGYPNINSDKLAREVLGTRERCTIKASEVPGESRPFEMVSAGEKKPGKVNHCSLCWQKTVFFIWSTSRSIDQERLRKITRKTPEHMAYPICLGCIKENKLLIEK